MNESKIKIVYKKVNDLIPYENNPRDNEKAVEPVANSIKEFGFKIPCVIDRDNVIICGHTRVKAAKKLGIKEVPCIMADDLDDEQVKAFRLADNKVGEIADWIPDLLSLELQDLDIDMSGFGFEPLAESEDNKEAQEDDYEPEPPIEPKAKLGDIYQLGKHRLMCGSSTDYKDVHKLMDDQLVDMVLTDPPYNVNYGQINESGYGKERNNGNKILNDNMDDNSFHKFLFDFYTQMNMALKPGGAFYIFHADSEGLNFRGALKEIGLNVRETLIWVKNALVLSRQDYQWKHEPCLYGWKEGASHYFIDDRTQTTVFEEELPDYSKMKKEQLVKILKDMTENLETTIIHENKPTKNDLHPTMKPIKLCGKLIKNSSKPGQIVFDGFGGSGSTLMACEQLGRTCYMMELDPKYIDVIIDRWEKYTGEKAIKL